MGYFCLVSWRYEVRIQACTRLGCASGDWTSIQTPEVAPRMQPPPHLEVQMAPGGFQPMVSLLWTGPLQPNGQVLYYELYRRQIATEPGKSNPVLTYNGSSSSFKDVELLPFTEYEYQVRNVCYQQLAPRWVWVHISACLEKNCLQSKKPLKETWDLCSLIIFFKKNLSSKWGRKGHIHLPSSFS